jgi:hypothetical protein
MAQDVHGSHLIITQDKVPTAAYQAIYHKLTSKIEKFHQTFQDAYEIEVQDIVQLDAMLKQTAKQFPVQGQNSVCDISFNGDTRLDSSSIERFSIINFAVNKPTKVVQYVFDFYSILPVEIKDAQDIVQRFKVIVKIDQDFIEEDNNMPFFMAGFSSGKNITLTIEYSDYAVSRNLQICVQDWVSTLKTRKIHPCISIIENRFDVIYNVVPFLFIASFLFGQSVIKNLNSQNVYRDLLQTFSYSILMYAFGKIIASQFMQKIQAIKPLTFIKITGGDLQRYDKICLKRKRELGLFTFIAVTVPAAIILNLFSSAIWLDINRH